MRQACRSPALLSAGQRRLARSAPVRFAAASSCVMPSAVPLPSSVVASMQKSSTQLASIVIFIALGSCGFYFYWTNGYVKSPMYMSLDTRNETLTKFLGNTDDAAAPTELFLPFRYQNFSNGSADILRASSDTDDHDHEGSVLTTCSRPDGRAEDVHPDLLSVPDETLLVSQLNKSAGVNGIRLGGWWKPERCLPRDKLAIVIPFRNREQHLLIFAKYLHPFLQRQQLEYAIYVIEQTGKSAFNRAMLMNIGFLEALKDLDWNCFAFHDVDHIPVDNGLSYACDSQPVHMAEKTDKWNWSLPYRTFVGGVVKQLRAHTELMNGFANFFWGWGGEDDDILVRWKHAKLSYKRPGGTGRYATVKVHHSRSSAPNPSRYKLLRQSGKRLLHDGLNSVQYHVLETKRHPLYTKVSVRVKRTT